LKHISSAADFEIENIKCVVFDFGFTLSSDLYFKVAPPNYPHWQKLIQQKIFSDTSLVDAWMQGEVTLTHIAALLSAEVELDQVRIIEYLKIGCQNLAFNPAVLEFALFLREQGVKTAIVTGNMDVFTEVVVPAHRLDEKFDAIVNSCDYQELNKEILWRKAFELLGSEIEYRNSLLIEDGHNNVLKFRKCGGFAYEYQNDELFSTWLDEIGYQKN
jgi:FMN phosphatase YigB (HAD superfamily)